MAASMMMGLSVSTARPRISFPLPAIAAVGRTPAHAVRDDFIAMQAPARCCRPAAALLTHGGNARLPIHFRDVVGAVDLIALFHFSHQKAYCVMISHHAGQN
jgi:hypothetical protein